MAKALTIMGMVIAVLVLILFSADLASGFPFKRASILMDSALIVCALILAYLSWTAFRDIK